MTRFASGYLVNGFWSSLGGNLELPWGRFATKSSLCHHFAPVIYNRPLPIIEDWFPRNSNFLGRNCQFSLWEPYVLNLYFTLKIFNSEPKVVNIKMSNHHSAVGSEKTKKYEIIKSHQAFTFGTVALDHTVFGHYIAGLASMGIDNICLVNLWHGI